MRQNRKALLRGHVKEVMETHSTYGHKNIMNYLRNHPPYSRQWGSNGRQLKGVPLLATEVNAVVPAGYIDVPLTLSLTPSMLTLSPSTLTLTLTLSLAPPATRSDTCAARALACSSRVAARTLVRCRRTRSRSRLGACRCQREGM